MTEQFGNMHEADSTTGGIPKVSAEIITAFLAEPHRFDELFNKIKDNDRELADFVLRRARELAPTNLEDRERFARLALEAFGVITSQVEANQLDALLKGTDGVEPDAT